MILVLISLESHLGKDHFLQYLLQPWRVYLEDILFNFTSNILAFLLNWENPFLVGILYGILISHGISWRFDRIDDEEGCKNKRLEPFCLVMEVFLTELIAIFTRLFYITFNNSIF